MVSTEVRRSSTSGGLDGETGSEEEPLPARGVEGTDGMRTRVER